MSTEKLLYPEDKENTQTSELEYQSKTFKENASEKIQQAKGKLEQVGHELQEKIENYPTYDYQKETPETIKPEQQEGVALSPEQKKEKITNLAENWVERMLNAEIALEHDISQKTSGKSQQLTHQISDKIERAETSLHNLKERAETSLQGLQENLQEKAERLSKAEISFEHEMSDKIHDLKENISQKIDQMLKDEVSFEHKMFEKTSEKSQKLTNQASDMIEHAETSLYGMKENLKDKAERLTENEIFLEHQMSDKIHDLKENLSQKADQMAKDEIAFEHKVSQKISEKSQKLTDQASDIIETAEDAFDDLKGNLKEKAERLSKAETSFEHKMSDKTRNLQENLQEKAERLSKAEISFEHEMSDKIHDLKENLNQKKDQMLKDEISFEHKMSQKMSEKLQRLTGQASDTIERAETSLSGVKENLKEKAEQLAQAEVIFEHEMSQKISETVSNLNKSLNQKKEQLISTGQPKYEQLPTQDPDKAQPAEIEFKSAFNAQNTTFTDQVAQGFHSLISTISQGVETVKRKISGAAEPQFVRRKTITLDEEEYPRTYHVGEEFQEVIAGFSKIVEDWQDEEVDEQNKVEVISGKEEEPGYQAFKDITNEVSEKRMTKGSESSLMSKVNQGLNYNEKLLDQAIKEGGKGSLVSEDKENMGGKRQGKAGNEKARVYESENMTNIA